MGRGGSLLQGCSRWYILISRNTRIVSLPRKEIFRFSISLSGTSSLRPSSIFFGLQICISLSDRSRIFILNHINLCFSLENTRKQNMCGELLFKNYFISLGIGILYWNKRSPYILSFSHRLDIHLNIHLYLHIL